MTILNTAIFMLAEFVTIGTFFKVYLGSTALPIVITVGVLTLIYTTVGGLSVSIATDQVQGLVAFVMMAMVAIYLGVTFSKPLPPMDDRVAGTTEVGLSSLFTMPCSLFSSAVFMESFWQRAFASENPQKLLKSSVVGAVATIFVVFISGFCGWLALWAEPDIALTANYNLYMFYGLKDSINLTTGTVNNWIGVLVLMMAVVMNVGSIDSLQNGLLASFSSFAKIGIVYYRRAYPGRLPADYQLPLPIARLVVVCVNVPLIILGTLGAANNWAILDLFAISNMLTCIISVPVMFGLSMRFYPYYGGMSFFLSWIIAFIVPSLYGIFKECWQSELSFDPTTLLWVCVPTEGSGGFGAGMAITWYRNGYRWQYFLLGWGGSVCAVVLLVGCNWLLAQAGVYLHGVPGFRPLYQDEEIEAVEKDFTEESQYPVMEMEDDESMMSPVYPPVFQPFSPSHAFNSPAPSAAMTP